MYPEPAQQVELTREEFNRATAMFDDMDRNHDGVVDIIEFQAVMETVAARSGREYSFESVRRMFMEADRNGDGVIDYDEWMYIQKKQKSKQMGLADDDSPPGSPGGAGGRDDVGSDTADGQPLISTRDELRALLVQLRSAPDTELADEADRLLRCRNDMSTCGDDGSGTLPPRAPMNAVTSADIELSNRLQLATQQSSGLHVDAPSPQPRLPRVPASPIAEGGGLPRVPATIIPSGGADPHRDPHLIGDLQQPTRVPATLLAESGGGERGLRRVSLAAAVDERARQIQREEEEERVGEQQQLRQRRGTSTAQYNAAQSNGTAAATTRADGFFKTAIASTISPLEILFTQFQFTGLTSSILTEMFEDASEWPAFAIEWSRYLAWTEVLNIDLTGLNRVVQVLRLSECLR